MRRSSRVKIALAIAGLILVLVLLEFGLDAIDHLGDFRDEDKSGIEETEIFLGDHKYVIHHNLENYLLLGTDASGNEEGTGEEYHGKMADFLLLVVLDRTNHTYGFLHIDRNTMAEIPIKDSEGKGEATYTGQLCTAHWYDGNPEMSCENTVQAVSDFLGGLPIDGYYSINMNDVGILNRAVDGVTVTLDEDFSEYDPEMTEGKTLTLNDEQAEIFVRGRMNVGDGTNAARMTRQEEYMKSFLDKVLEAASKNPDFVNDLYKALKDRAVTDMPGSRLSAIANQVHEGTSNGLLRFEGETKEGKALKDELYHAEFYPTEESVVKTLEQLTNMKKEF